MSDRTVHASNRNWEVVRYDRAGKWYAEWKGDDGCPGFVGDGGWIRSVNGNGRVPMTMHDVVVFVTCEPGMVPHFNRPGGSTFDRRVTEALTDET